MSTVLMALPLHRSRLQSGVLLADLPPSMYSLWLDVFTFKHWNPSVLASRGVSNSEEHEAKLLKQKPEAGQEPDYFEFLLDVTQKKVLNVRCLQNMSA
jgi:hypothetical protein